MNTYQVTIRWSRNDAAETSLRKLSTKQLENPWKKRDNIPL